MTKKIKRILIVGICTATILSGTNSVVYANSFDTSEAPASSSASTIAPVKMLQKELVEDTEPLQLISTSTSTGCTIKFNKIGSYSIYQNGIVQKINKSDLKEVNKKHSSGELVDEYVFMNGTTLGDQVEINDLKPATTYNFLAYKNQEPIPTSLIKEFSFNTKPEEITVEKDTKSTSVVKIKWNYANNAVKYEIYRDGELLDTVEDNSYTDKGLKSSTTYKYQVKARYENDEIDSESKISDELEIKTDALAISSSSSNTGTFTFRNGVASGSMGLPSVSGECKTWANYQAVTMKSSPQYKLLNADNCYTDPATGIRMVDDCYCVALGSYYGSTIGQKYLIKLSSGNEFKAILCDQKSDRHTDANHQYAVNNKDIIEFYIDRRYKPAAVGGSYGSLPQFAGAVISIEKIV